MRIAVIHDGSDVDVLGQVVLACDAADVLILDVDVTAPSASEAAALRAGDAILRTGCARALQIAEERLAGPGVATVSPPAWPVAADLASHARAHGLAVRDEHVVTALDRAGAAAAVDRLGGFPLGVRAADEARGDDLVRVDSLPSLYSALDLLHAGPTTTLLGPWEPAPALWRVLGVDGAATHAATRVTTGLSWYGPGGAVRTGGAREDVADLACATLAVLGARVGVVDLLERSDGTLAVLHAESPPPWGEVGAWGGRTAHAAIVRALASEEGADRPSG